MDRAGNLILALVWKDDIGGIGWRDLHPKGVKRIRPLGVRITLSIFSKA
jgi:hypothetical protein